MNTYKNLSDLPVTLSVDDLAGVLGISRMGAYGLCKSPGFPSMRIGKRILIPKEGLIRWLERQSGYDSGKA